MIEENQPSRFLEITVGILGTFTGIFTGLIGTFVSANYLEFLAQANRPAGSGPAGAGTSLIAMFFCTPVIVISCLGIRWLGNKLGRRLAGNRYSPIMQLFIIEVIGSALVGMAFGVLPWILFVALAPFIQ